jgi:hypothetical protein
MLKLIAKFFGRRELTVHEINTTVDGFVKRVCAGDDRATGEWNAFLGTLSKKEYAAYYRSSMNVLSRR